MRKTNKSIAGFHLLMILSAVDYKFHTNEEKVIREYLEEEFPLPINFDNEIDQIASLKPEQWKNILSFKHNAFMTIPSKKKEKNSKNLRKNSSKQTM
jgi:hypothetical protein